MTGIPVAALLLAAALRVMPGHPRAHLFPSPPPRVHAVPMVVLPAVLVLLLAILTTPAVAAVAAMAAAMARTRLRRLRLRRRRRDEAESMTAALETLVGELRVGTHPVRAFGVAAEESDGSVASALSTVTARAALGADVAAGLRAVAEESTVPFHWTRIAVYWGLAADHGLPMSTLMRAAQRDIVDRQRFSRQVQASLAGARATSAILAALPVLGIALGQLVGAHPLRFLLSDGVGGWLLIGGAALIIAGLVWSDRIVEGMTI